MSQAACNTATDAYIKLYESNKGTACDATSFWNLNNREEYCNSCWQTMYDSLSKVNTACGSLINEEVKYNYESMTFLKAYYCSKDSNGKYCDQVAVNNFNYKKPYSEWTSSDCKNSCTSVIDSAIRENLDNTKLLNNYNIDGSLFANNGNQLTCKSGSSSTIGSSSSANDDGDSLQFSTDSGASQFTAQMAFLTILIIFIINLLK